MRKVKLYTLKEEDVWVISDYVEIGQFTENRVRIQCSNDAILNAPVEVQRLPVEFYRETTGVDGNERVTDYLIAVDPKVRKVLQIKEKELKAQVDHLNHLNIKLNSEIVSLKLDKLTLEKSIERLIDFTNLIYNLTFWQKIKFLFTKQIKGDTHEKEID